MKIGFYLITGLALITLNGCETEKIPYKYEFAITSTPKNITGLNSYYDDYNSDIPYRSKVKEIYFSTNRKSFGEDFDIIHRSVSFSYHEEEGMLDLYIPPTPPHTPEGSDLLDKINTEHDEFGPYSYENSDDELFFYATEVNDTFDIKYVLIGYQDSNQVASTPISIPVINKYGDDLYPTITKNKEELFFCSNQNDSVFNIYSANYNKEITGQSLLESNNVIVDINQVLSSPQDDKCPSITNDFMVFSSNLAGGSGGFDLWYSRFENGAWSTPKNFGANINSAKNEYRPIVFRTFEHNVMIFSSDRPGGKGGYDLYILDMENYL